MIKYSAIVLAAGSGKRMQSTVKKQYMEILGRPLMFYALDAFQKSEVDEIVLVVSPGDEDYVQKEIVDRYKFSKVAAIVPGGAERYDSVYAGLQICRGDYVLIHDGARAFLHQEIIRRCLEDVQKTHACIVGMPSKDTVKIVDEHGYVRGTPLRSQVWNVQTPQCFQREAILQAYEEMQSHSKDGITDDAMVMERFSSIKIHLIEGDYENVKVTTKDDILTAEMILKNRGF